mmetsp:Transcript_7805/g.18125  ORF Transcript_7805/g.18125 Transcript_7805/m.18125 type:complete len:172 (+) Transcript_7805:26-541(+)
MACGGAKVYKDLIEEVDQRSIECLNQSEENPWKNCLINGLRDDDSVFLESDCDEQLLLSVPFQQKVRVHSIALKAPSDGRAPAVVKIFTNTLHMDFDNATEQPATQVLELTPEQCEGKPIELKFVKFQNVTHMTFFVETNQGGEETSAIQKLAIFGEPFAGTNMNELKKVG